MALNSRSKGANGEREFAKWLQDNLGLDFLPQRNLEQVRSGGADIMNVEPFCFEVKRCQVLNLKQWWVQVTKAFRRGDIRVVAYRQNRQPWRFLISAGYLGLAEGFIQLDEKVGKQWLKDTYQDTQD